MIERSNVGEDSYTYGYNLAIVVLISSLIIAFLVLLGVMIKSGDCMIMSCTLTGLVVMCALIAYHSMILGIHILMIKRINSIPKPDSIGVAYQTISRISEKTALAP
jgi:uncharacterized membrane protein